MDDNILQELLLKHNICIARNMCGYTWGMVSNMFYSKPKHAFQKFVTDLNALLDHNELHIKKVKAEVVCYTVYHDKDKIISFYKSKKKKTKYGIMIINDKDALQTIIETIQ